MWWQPVKFGKIKAIPPILLWKFPPFYGIMCIHRLRIHDFEENLPPDFLMFMKDHFPKARRSDNFIAREMLAMKVSAIIPICNNTPSEIRTSAIEIHYGDTVGISFCHCMAAVASRRIASAKQHMAC